MPDWLYGPTQHYPTSGARYADLTVHIVGLVLALSAGGLLVGVATRLNSPGAMAAICVYAIGVVAMLAFSTAYNFSPASMRPRLRRLDHAGIFLMIAASYTPFTTLCLSGAWGLAMTVGVWSIAIAGVLGKLFLPGLHKRFWIGVYLALGWMALVALKPMIRDISWVALLLLAVGGADLFVRRHLLCEQTPALLSRHLARPCRHSRRRPLDRGAGGGGHGGAEIAPPSIASAVEIRRARIQFRAAES